MKIVVCPLSQVSRLVAARAPERVVSLLDPEFAFPDLGPAYQGRHLRLSLHDIHQDDADHVAPAASHVDQLLSFLALWRRSAPLLIHCRAGIGRSTATAFIAACLHLPHRCERDMAESLRRISPLARPNERLVQLADAAMCRNGRMADAIIQTGRNLAFDHFDENLPFELTFTCVSESR
jgi:predicted protein tyrosine phosphatase